MTIIYHWDFGDGTQSNEENPEHVYTKTGRYTVVLTITDEADMIENKMTKILYVYIYDKEIIKRKTNKCFCYGVVDETGQN